MSKVIRDIEVFVRRKVRQYFDFHYQKKDRRALSKKEVVVIANNCWGGQIYQWLNMPYNSPLAGLFLYGPCYMKLLNNLHYYLQQNLVFIEESKYKDRPKTYPLALLDDIEVHFTHYKTEEEAKAKWERRTQRLLQHKDVNEYFYMICDRERVTYNMIKEFHKLPFKNKISFAIYNVDGLNNKQHIKVYERPKDKKETTPNGKKMFKLTFLYFDLIHWFNTGEIKRTRFKN